MKTTNRILAVTALAGALIAAPVAAYALPYAPGAGSSVSDSTVVAGEAFELTAEAGFFIGGEDVLVTMVGENASEGSIQLAAAIDPQDALAEVFAAGADGSLSVSVTTPEDAAGLYTVTAIGAESGATLAQTVTIEPADAAPAAGGAAGGLANTGADSAAAFWFAGGLLALGATTVITLNVVRRNRAQA